MDDTREPIPSPAAPSATEAEPSPDTTLDLAPGDDAAEDDAAEDEGPVTSEPASDADASPVVGPEPDAEVRALCTGTDPIACHFGGPPGNYDVTVVLGGVDAANTSVEAETRRAMLAPVATAAGETRRLTFGVNVRQPEGQPIQDVPAGTPGLDLYFRGNGGTLPAVTAIGYAPAAEPLVVYLAGDSTVCDQSSADYGGWGQQLPQHFDYPVVVANYADSGESSGSFLRARLLFGVVESRLEPGDWVLIQFGHNDKMVSAAQFHDNLTALVTRTRAKGALPVLVTPVARAQFQGDRVSTQHVNGLGANLPEIVARVADEQGAPLLDMTARTSEWLTEVGVNGWQPFHALGTDRTHTNDAGAAVTAAFVPELLVAAGLEGLVEHLR